MSEYDQEVEDKVNNKLKHPQMYKVMLLNDDFTPFEFVVHILMKIFGKKQEVAESITMDIHNRNEGVCGVYSKDEAETYVALVNRTSQENGFPLKAKMKKD